MNVSRRPLIGVTLDSEAPGGYSKFPWYALRANYADAIAASVAVGIETAQLVEAQREQFIQTVTTLARAVEVRYQYTGDHTRRVTDYSLMLAEEHAARDHVFAPAS